MCTFDRVGHSRHHSAPLLAAQPSKQKEPGIVVLLISSTHHDYLTRTSSDNPQTPLYYHLIENVLPFASQIIKMMTTCSARLDKMLVKQCLFISSLLLLNAFIYEFTTSLGAHIQIREFLHAIACVMSAILHNGTQSFLLPCTVNNFIWQFSKWKHSKV